MLLIKISQVLNVHGKDKLYSVTHVAIQSRDGHSQDFSPGYSEELRVARAYAKQQFPNYRIQCDVVDTGVAAVLDMALNQHLVS